MHTPVLQLVSHASVCVCGCVYVCVCVHEREMERKREGDEGQIGAATPAYSSCFSVYVRIQAQCSIRVLFTHISMSTRNKPLKTEYEHI